MKAATPRLAGMIAVTNGTLAISCGGFLAHRGVNLELVISRQERSCDGVLAELGQHLSGIRTRPIRDN
jgi:hypothetical protein